MTEDLAAHYGVLREGCGLWQGLATGLLYLKGEDRVRLLNGLVTCEVKDMAPGQGVRGFFTDVKGHVLADVVVRASQDRLGLEVPATQIAYIADHVAKYIVVDRVEVERVDNRRSLSFVGPQAVSVLAILLSPESVPGTRWGHLETSILGHDSMVALDDHFGVPAVTVWASPPGVAEIIQGILESKGSPLLMEVESAAIDVVRVEEGVPRFGVDFSAENLPQETGLEDTVSYSKGCYLGQEVVARLHHRGQVARCVRRLRSTSDELPLVGSVLILDGRQAGRISSAAKSPDRTGVTALGIVQRRAMQIGTELQLESGQVMKVV